MHRINHLGNLARYRFVELNMSTELDQQSTPGNLARFVVTDMILTVLESTRTQSPLAVLD